MPLFTFIMDYKGGTYISQVRSSFKNAHIKWAGSLDVSGIYGFGEAAKQELIQEMNYAEPALLDKLKKTWIITTLIRGDLALIHLIETANDEQTATNK